MTRVCFALAFALLLTFAAPARASEPEMFGMGARSPGMAGTGVADADGYDATYENPAGLVGPTNRRLTLGYVHAGYDLNLDGMHHPVDKTDGLLLGADIPIPFGGFLRDRVALGLGFYFPFGVINRAQAPFPDQPGSPCSIRARRSCPCSWPRACTSTSASMSAWASLALAALVGTIDITPRAGASRPLPRSS